MNLNFYLKTFDGDAFADARSDVLPRKGEQVVLSDGRRYTVQAVVYDFRQRYIGAQVIDIVVIPYRPRRPRRVL